MSSNSGTNVDNNTPSEITSHVQSFPPTQHVNTTTIPLNVDPVTTVFPNKEEQHSPVVHKGKSKKKKNSKSAVVKKTPKPKRGESKTSLTMEDLYLKENPFNIPNAGANVESSVKESKAADVEASKDDPTTHSEKAFNATEKTEDFEKGNSDKTLKTTDDKIAENLRVDDKICDDIATCKMTESMACKGADNTDISKTVEIPFEKQDVGPDVETSLDQQVDQGNMADDTVEPNAEVQGKDASNNDEILVTDKDKKDETKPQEVVDDSDSEQTIDKEDDIVDLDDVSSDLNHTVADTYKENNMAKRLSSSSGKAVPTATKTPITRMKSTVVRPNKKWSKVTPRASTGKKGKKRKVVESSKSEYEHVEENGSPIPVSVTKKSSGKKTSTIVSVVPTDNISFHYPEYAQR
jgi:hypothetical protein